MTSQTTAGRCRLGEHVIELRAPRLADSESWRRTNLEHEKRLRPAFGDPHTDWAAEHSACSWATQWWRSRRDPSVLVARVLTVADGDDDRVVGQQVIAGVDPRTGHTESSTWIAGLPNSKAVAFHMSITNLLTLFDEHPGVPFILSPVPVDNGPAIALSEALGFTHLQTLRGLREYDGVPTDHRIYFLANTDQARSRLERTLASLGAESVQTPAGAARPSPRVLLGLARLAVRRLRARKRAEAPTTPLPAVTTEEQHEVRFDPAGDSRYRVCVDGRGLGLVQLHRDQGSSTIELIDRLRADAPVAAADTAIVAAMRHAAENQNTRRLTIALAERNSRAAARLAQLGFETEGPALPTLGDEATARESWTRVVL